VNRLKQSKKIQAQSLPNELVDPANQPEPHDVAGYIRRGFAFYSRKEYVKAELDFKHALELDSSSIDALYGLGMVLKFQKLIEDSVKAFQKALELIVGGGVTDPTRTAMLRRLVLGHINELSIGDWNLEKEIWHRV
jgi:tetratricopeptide (TPR) repeat protein